MNNPLAFVKAFRNPEIFIQEIMKNNQLMQNPLAKNAIEMYQRGDKDGISKMVENLCKERGLKPEEVINQIKSQFGV